ncbi:YfbU family protein [Peribacillus butanolivorans]|uniref:YfbU family protein n=1 Tax=Peribacillus butanolivorans TaxID=421767 RepID=UPI0035E278DE
MDLTKKERLFLANQYLILEKLYPEEKLHYEQLRKALERGYQLNYEDAVEWYYDEFSKEDSTFVIDVLDMYSQMLFANDNAEDEEKLESGLKFPGFDGNKETSYLGYVRYYLKDLGRFDELKTNSEFGDFNSHRPMVKRYERMLRVWDSTESKYNLSMEDVKRILNTR